MVMKDWLVFFLVRTIESTIWSIKEERARETKDMKRDTLFNTFRINQINIKKILTTTTTTVIKNSITTG